MSLPQNARYPSIMVQTNDWNNTPFADSATLREIPQKNGVHGVQNQITKFTMTIINHSLSTYKRSRSPHPLSNSHPISRIFVWHKPPENPPSKAAQGDVLTTRQNATHLKNQNYLTYQSSRQKKSLCAPCALARNHRKIPL